ncbi:MAG: hypothetical protein ACJ76Z_02835 [Thermoleophilaceae bacterium]
MKTPIHIVVAAATCAATAALAAPAPAAVVRTSPGGHPHTQVPAPVASTAAVRLPAATFGGPTSQKQPIVMSLAKGRRTGKITLAYKESCGAGGNQDFAWEGLRPLNLSKKGAYKASSKRRLTFEDGWADVESYQVKGVAKKGSARGTFHMHDVWYDEHGQQDSSCDTGKIRFRVRDKGILAGTTDEDAPVVMAVAPGLAHLNRLMVPWTAACESGDWIWGTGDINAPVDPNGVFSATLTAPTLDMGDGKQALETETTSGLVTATNASGTWQVTATVIDAGEAAVDSCASDELSFELG